MICDVLVNALNLSLESSRFFCLLVFVICVNFDFRLRLHLFKMAERERFELSRRFLPCTLSKGVPSATRPSLREM
jgi:hypothetical protein